MIVCMKVQKVYISSTIIPNPRESHPVPARHSQAYKKVQKAEP